jgi:hypothetical protein
MRGGTVTSSSTPALAALIGDEERNAFAEQGVRW